MTLHRPHIVAILAINLLGILFHAILVPPMAGEATRWYSHGGLLTDFVGQLSPVSRLRLVICDAVTLFLQLVILAISSEKRNISDGDGSSDEVLSTTQDHDAEEQGFRRSEDAEAIEMQHLQPIFEVRARGENDENEHGSTPSDGPTVGVHSNDRYYSGQHVVAVVDIVDTIRTQWRYSCASAASTIGQGSTATAANGTDVFSRRPRIAIRIGGREIGS